MKLCILGYWVMDSLSSDMIFLIILFSGAQLISRRNTFIPRPKILDICPML